MTVVVERLVAAKSGFHPDTCHGLPPHTAWHAWLRNAAIAVGLAGAALYLLGFP